MDSIKLRVRHIYVIIIILYYYILLWNLIIIFIQRWVFVLASENANNVERKAKSEKETERKSAWMNSSECLRMETLWECKREKEIGRIYEINFYKIVLRDQDRWLALVHDIFSRNYNIPFPLPLWPSIAAVASRNEVKNMTRYVNERLCLIKPSYYNSIILLLSLWLLILLSTL